MNSMSFYKNILISHVFEREYDSTKNSAILMDDIRKNLLNGAINTIE